MAVVSHHRLGAPRCPPPPGENGKRIRELTRIVQKRFGFEDNTVELFAERVAEKGLCAQAQAEALKYAPVGVVCGFDFWVLGLLSVCARA